MKHSTLLVLENVIRRILMQKVNHLKNMVANSSPGTVLWKEKRYAPLYNFLCDDNFSCSLFKKIPTFLYCRFFPDLIEAAITGRSVTTALQNWAMLLNRQINGTAEIP